MVSVEGRGTLIYNLPSLGKKKKLVQKKFLKRSLNILSQTIGSSDSPTQRKC